MSLLDILDNASKKNPQKVALRSAGEALTYEQLRSRVSQLANALNRAGISTQDHVAFMCPNIGAYIEIFFACAQIGAISQHLNAHWSPKVSCELIEDTHAKVVIIPGANREILEYLQRSLSYQPEFILIDGTAKGALDYEDFLQSGSPDQDVAEVDDQSTAVLFYSSGTTGKPKGVMLTHKNFLVQAEVCSQFGHWRSDEIFLCPLPLYHSICISMVQLFFVGGELVLCQCAKPEEVIRLINTHKVTRTTLIPHLIKGILDRLKITGETLPSLECIIYGASAMPTELVIRCNEELDCSLLQGYGTTETTASITMLAPEEHLDPRHAFTVGKPLPGVELAIVNDNGAECATGEEGEVIVKSKTIMKGYYSNPQLTEKVIIDGWYHTRDIGFLDSDGFLHLVDRKDNMIVSGGENIYPSEIELCIKSMGSFVEDVVARGVPDEKWGTSLIAYVVTDKTTPTTAEEVIQFCANHLARYKKPRTVYFVDELPRTKMGKLDKERFNELYSSLIH